MGFVGLGLILITLFGGVRLPGGLPGAFVSVGAAVAVSTADLIERPFFRSALAFFAAALLCLFGVMHSSTPTGTLFLPWRAGSHVPYHFAAAYAAPGVIVFLAGRSQEEDRAGVRCPQVIPEFAGVCAKTADPSTGSPPSLPISCYR